MAPGREPRTYKMAFPIMGGAKNCPAKGYWRRAATWTAMWVHFLHWYVRETVIILDEFNLPHPQFPWCNILVP